MKKGVILLILSMIVLAGTANTASDTAAKKRKGAVVGKLRIIEREKVKEETLTEKYKHLIPPGLMKKVRGQETKIKHISRDGNWMVLLEPGTGPYGLHGYDKIVVTNKEGKIKWKRGYSDDEDAYIVAPYGKMLVKIEEPLTYSKIITEDNKEIGLPFGMNNKIEITGDGEYLIGIKDRVNETEKREKIYKYDKRGNKIMEKELPEGFVSDMITISPDGNVIVVGGDGRAIILDGEGNEIARIGVSGPIGKIDISEDGGRIAIMGHTGLKVYDVEKRRVIYAASFGLDMLNQIVGVPEDIAKKAQGFRKFVRMDAMTLSRDGNTLWYVVNIDYTLKGRGKEEFVYDDYFGETVGHLYSPTLYSKRAKYLIKYDLVKGTYSSTELDGVKYVRDLREKENKCIVDTGKEEIEVGE